MIDYFMHIPKTGGTSLTSFLDSKYDSKKILKPQTWEKLFDTWPEDFSQYDLIRGHFGCSIKNLFEPKKLRYITILRNPLYRSISQFFHMLYDGIHNNWRVNFPYKNIKELLYKEPNLISNIQIKYLTTDLILDKKNLPKKRPFIFLEPYENLNQGQWEKLFYKACERLDSFYFVGFLEQFQESLDKLCDLMNWPSIDTRTLKKNQRRIRNEIIDKKSIKKIEELNKWDFKLYEYALEKYKLY